MHDIAALSTLAGGLAVALVLGWVTQRLGLSTLVGYMLAGVVVGPNTLGAIADPHLATQMAEIGVVLLMFGVGMHFHPQELLRVWRIAVPGAIAQSAIATIAGWGFARAFGWSNAAGFVFGLALSVASTVVLMRMLIDRGRLATRAGHVAVGWLIVEDMFTVVALVVLPVLATEVTSLTSLGVPLLLALGKAVLFAVLVWFVGTNLVGKLLERMARTRSEELFTLLVFVLALGIAVIAAEVFHVSVALGAFFGGLVVGQSRFGPQATIYMTPFRDVFSALFFVSVGMLFDPAFVIRHPFIVLGALIVILIVKPLVALGLVMLIRGEWPTGTTVAVGLAQIGEFSFVLAALGGSMGILPDDALDALVAAGIFSIALNPILFRLLPRFERGLTSEPRELPPEIAEAEATPARPIIVAGSGDIARRIIGRALRSGVPIVVVSDDDEALDSVRAAGVETVYGDPARAEVLRAAHGEHARVLVASDGALAQKLAVIAAMRSINDRVTVIAPASNHVEHARLSEQAGTVVTDVYEGVSAAILRAAREKM